MLPHARTVIEDTEENRAICSRYCRNCPNYKTHHYENFQPDGLFCARGMSSCPDKKEIRCYCLSCEIFLKNHLRIGYFCTKD